jgi:hypothetical protein
MGIHEIETIDAAGTFSISNAWASANKGQFVAVPDECYIEAIELNLSSISSLSNLQVVLAYDTNGDDVASAVSNNTSVWTKPGAATHGSIRFTFQSWIRAKATPQDLYIFVKGNSGTATCDSARLLYKPRRK